MGSDYGSSDYGSREYTAGRAFTGAACTLNGQPAKVVGRSLDFAIVATLDPSGPEHEWSWPAVARVMRAGGTFIA